MIYENVMNYLSYRLDLEEFLKPIEVKKFYLIIAKYLTNRTTSETFEKNFEETLDFYSFLGFSISDALHGIMGWPAIMHANKEELLKKYLVLAKVVDSSNVPIRDDIMVNHSKDLMTGFDLLYARTMFFLDADLDMVRHDNITRRKLIKTTNDEFEKIYRISRESLLDRYEVPKNVLDSLLSWDENDEIREAYEKQKGRRKG